MKQQRGIGPFKSQPTMAPVGRAWRLGILLLTRDGHLFRVGRITRALEPTRSQYLTAGVEQRKDDRRAASRGKFTTGEVVNFDYEAIDQDPAALRSGQGPLSRVGDELVVQWGPSPGDTRDLPGYLADRATLLEEE